MLAVIQTGGKQYNVQEGEIIKIEKLEGKAGDKIIFDQVLLIDDGKEVKIGKPVLEGVEIEGKILEQTKADKITIIKQKAKKRYLKKQGHRQNLTVVEVTNI
jgi:large subunit ribosomal protein L21